MLAWILAGAFAGILLTCGIAIAYSPIPGEPQHTGRTGTRPVFAWPIAICAVAGAFLIGGIGGSFASIILGLWGLPGAGFLAAFSVVCVAYLTAPRSKLAFSIACFVFGAFAAWVLVGTAWYPESYGEKAYEPTSLPLAATCGGGVLGLVAVVVFDVREQLRDA